MKVKNTTAFLVGARVTSRRPPQPEMTLVVRAAFALRPGEPLAPLDDQGALTAEVFRPDDDDRRGELLYPGDFADFKLNAEVMLRGSCHPPGKRPVPECLVRFSVGAWSKTLRVVGRRVWSDRFAGAVSSDPLPFTQMSLDYTESFGGPGWAQNPVGTGFETDRLPTVERPDEPIRSRRIQPEPASFGPINPAWPQRASRVGKEYGRSYREKRAPFYAEDFDFAYFHAAPRDQQIEGYLRGDEAVVLHNLHPAAPVLSARLPGLRIRAFVKDVRGRGREVRMSLDTLFVDLEKETLHLTWRGVDAVAEDDLSDVTFARVASEPMASEPLPPERYLAELDAFEADPLGFGEQLPPGFMELADRFAAERRGDASPDEPEQGSAARIPGLVKAFVARGTGDGPGGGSNAGASVPDAELRGALAQAGGGGGAAPPFVPLKPGAIPRLPVGPQVRAMLAQVAEIKKVAAARGLAVAGLDKVDAFVNDPRLQQLDPTYKPPRPDDPPPQEPGPGRDLSGQDLSDRDLHGLDLTGANLEGVILTRANLAGTILARANLRYAVLYEANLSGADLEGADLTLAQVARASAAGASFRGATIEQASFEQADLHGATLEGARGEYVRFSSANLTRAKAAGASLARSQLDHARLEQADFSAAVLSRALFLEARARGVDLSRATLHRASFEGADLRGASLAGAKGDGTAWMRAKLDGADLRYAWMTGAHFMEVSANRATFLEANLKEARFYRAALEGASFVRANLFGADFRKASLTGGSFAGASLYDAKFLGAAGKGCDFTGANLKRSTLESPG